MYRDALNSSNECNHEFYTFRQMKITGLVIYTDCILLDCCTTVLLPEEFALCCIVCCKGNFITECARVVACFGTAVWQLRKRSLLACSSLWPGECCPVVYSFH